MVTINLLPQARKKRQTQLTHQDKMLMFVVVAVLVVLAGSYAFVRVTAMQETAHLADLNSQIAALADEQKLLDTNRALKEAQTLYRSLGYAEIARYNDNPYADHWFEKRL